MSDDAVLTAELLATTWRPTEVCLSPEGSRVAWVAAPYCIEEEHGESAIWVASVSGSGPGRRWTYGGQDSSPRWSPDGERLAFLSDRAKRGTAGLFVLHAGQGEAGGGEAERLVVRERAVAAFAWSPGGERIAFLAPDEPDDEDRRRETEHDDAQVFGERWQHHRLWAVDVASGEVTQLTDGDVHLVALEWSPDGSSLAVIARDTPQLDVADGGRVCLVSVDDRSRRLVEVCPAPGAEQLFFTATGQRIVFVGDHERNCVSASTVWSVPPAAGSAAEIIGPGPDEPACVPEARPGPVGERVMIRVLQGLDTRLEWCDAVTGERSQIWESTGDVMSIAVAAWGGSSTATSPAPVEGQGVASGTATKQDVVLAVAEYHDRGPLEVWAGPPSGLRCVSNHGAALAAIEFGVVEDFHWVAADGLELDGILITPPHRSERRPGDGSKGAAGERAGDASEGAAGERAGDASEGAAGEVAHQPPWPLVVLPHGGPYGRSGRQPHCSPGDWGQWLATAGYAVLLPNYRGGAGHGHRFAAAARGDMGGAEGRDVLAAVDAAVERGIADPERLGIGGWSQGGFLSAWLVTQTDRFKAAIVGAGVTDWTMLGLTSDAPSFENALAGGPAWAETVRRHNDERSAVVQAESVTTPVLILHGERDERVPLNQAVGFHRALRDRGATVELVVYPREPHSAREKAHQVDILRRVREWCERWL